MNKKIIPLLTKARSFLAKHGIKGVKWEKLNQEGISIKEMVENFNSPEELVSTILQYERETFEQIFETYNFEGYNAIDVLLLVSKEINDNLFYINPDITQDLEGLFPDIYAEHTKQREEFSRQRMIININNGIKQGVYKKELNAEETTIKIWNMIEKFYQDETLRGEGFSFTTIIEKILNTYIKLVTNEDGLNFYRNRKQLYGVLGFGW